MVVKINVSMPKEILEKLDEAAREANSSRSALLSHAVKHFLEEKEEETIRDISAYDIMCYGDERAEGGGICHKTSWLAWYLHYY